MIGRWCGLSLLIAGMAAATADAQRIQQPAVHVFATDSSVLVPDSGIGWAAGSGSASLATSGIGTPMLGPVPMLGGPFDNQSYGTVIAAGGVSITAQIHDLKAMDEFLLRGSAPPAGYRPSTTIAVARSNMAAAPADSIADIRRQQTEQDATLQAGWLADLERGRKYLAEGKAGIARIYFQAVARHAYGDVKDQALAELERAQPAPPAPGRARPDMPPALPPPPAPAH